MACQTCGALAPTQNIRLKYNVGMIVARKSYRIEGDLCRDCIDKYFKEYQVKNLTLGWWGTISFFMTWANLISNTVEYSKARQLPRAAPGTQRVGPGGPAMGATGRAAVGYQVGAVGQQPYQMGQNSTAALQNTPSNAVSHQGASSGAGMGAQSYQQAPASPQQTLTQDTIARMQPVAGEYWARLCQGEPIDTLAPIMGQKAMVDSYQAWLYGAGMIKAAHAQAAQQQVGSVQPPLNV